MNLCRQKINDLLPSNKLMVLKDCKSLTCKDVAFKTKYNVSKFLNIFWNLPRYERYSIFWVKSFRFIISKANHLKSIIAWSPVSYDQNYCISRIQPNRYKRDGRRFHRKIRDWKCMQLKHKWFGIRCLKKEKKSLLMSLYIFSVLVRCLNLSHVTTLRVLSKFYCWNLLDHIYIYILYMLYSLYPFWKVFLFILNIFPFYYGNSKWNTCFRSENLKCATPFKKLTKQFSDSDHLIFFFM